MLQPRQAGLEQYINVIKKGTQAKVIQTTKGLDNSTVICHFTQAASSSQSKCPNHRNLLLLIANLTIPYFCDLGAFLSSFQMQKSVCE